jgi:hypothetical protein
MDKYNIIKYLLLLAGLLLGNIAAKAQLVNTNFGQNRLQYEQKKWYRYEAEHFAISFPKELEELAEYVIETAEADYAQLKTTLEYQVRNKIEIILYNDYVSYLQNNIGLYNKTMNTGGTTKLFSHKILLYMYASRYDLHYQLREGIARSLVNRMIHGSNLQEVVQNSVSMQLPPWFSEGMVGYGVSEWDVVADDQLRDAFLSGKYTNFVELSRANPRLAGRAMFHYIAQKHGSAAVGNLLYLTRINRSIESGFLYVFGSSFYAMAGNWFNFYKDRYNADNKDRKIPSKGELTLRTHKHAPVSELIISPDGKKTAYTEIHKGKYYIWLHDIASDKAEVIWQGGLRDHSEHVPLNYPRLAFTQNNLQLIFSTHEKHQISIQQYSLGDKKISNSRPIKDLDFINHIDAWQGQEIIVSALKNGQSDIFSINLQNGKVEPISNDVYDDMLPAVVRLGGKTGIAFTSVRPKSQFGNGNKDDKTAPLFAKIYFYDLSSRSRQLIQLTDADFTTDLMPVAANNGTIAYLSDANGISNRYICQLDTTIAHYNRHIRLKSGEELVFHADSALAENMDTTQIDSQYLQPVMVIKGKSYCNSDYSRSLIAHHIATDGDKVADLIFYEDKYRIFIRDLALDRREEPQRTIYNTLFMELWGYNFKKTTNAEPSKSIIVPIPEQKKDSVRTAEEELRIVETEIRNDSTPAKDTTKIDIDNYLFQSEFKDIKNPVKKDSIAKRDPNFNRDSIPTQPIVLIEGENGDIKKQNPTPQSRPSLNADKNALLHQYDPSRKTAYRNLFRADAFTMQFDNTPLFGGLDMYLGNFYKFTPLSFGAKTNFSDIFENYRLELGLRVPVIFNGLDCYFIFEDRKHKIDKKYSFYRRSRTEDYTLVDTVNNLSQAARGRNIKHLAQVEFSYPFDRYQSLRAMVAMQHDQVAIIGQEINSLAVPRYIENRTWLRLEYVFDNTVDIRQNIRKGMRFKAYTDLFKPLAIKTDSVFKIDFSGAATANIGFDFRYYKPLDKKTIFALRVAGASSLGKDKILYSLGGIENWVAPTTDQLIPLPQQDNFAYQTLAAPLRGFSNNIRNGSSFLVANAELRIPLAEYLNLGSARSNALRTLQLVPFFDIGTAWQGLSPFSADNPLNTSIIDRSSAGTVSPIRVRVNYYRQPIVMGFGFGFRAAVSGYFLRADLGFGVETGLIRTPKLQFGIGTDF